MASFENRYQDRIKEQEATRALAKTVNIGHNQFAILKALADGDYHDYHEIITATGIYSNLPGELRMRHSGSLGANGLVQEERLTTNSKRRIFVFRLTAKGKSLLRRAGVKLLPSPARPFLERHYQRRERDKAIGRQAKRVGLRGIYLMILKVLADSDCLDYHEIAQRTGIYSGLPWWLLPQYDNSLADRGLVQVDVTFTHDGKEVTVFRITSVGKKLLHQWKVAASSTAS